MNAWLETHGRGPVEIKAGKSGQFDVVIDGRLVCSRYDTGRFSAGTDLEKI